MDETTRTHSYLDYDFLDLSHSYNLKFNDQIYDDIYEVSARSACGDRFNRISSIICLLIRYGGYS